MSLEKFKDRLKQVGGLYVDLYPYRISNSGVIEFLILKRKLDVELADTWQAISGKIKKDEAIKDAFWRLANEKIGINPLKMFKIDYVSTFYDDYYDTVMMVPVAACEVAKDVEVKISELHIDFKWLTKDEADKELIWPNQKTSIDLISKMLSSNISSFYNLK